MTISVTSLVRGNVQRLSPKYIFLPLIHNLQIGCMTTDCKSKCQSGKYFIKSRQVCTPHLNEVMVSVHVYPALIFGATTVHKAMAVQNNKKQGT